MFLRVNLGSTFDVLVGFHCHDLYEINSNYVYFLSNGQTCNRLIMFAITFSGGSCFAALVSISFCHSAVIAV